MSSLPKDVQSVAQILANDPQDERSEIAAKITADSPELESMWKALETRSAGTDDLWVWGFLSAAADAAQFPRFHSLTGGERRSLAEKIEKRCDQLAHLLEEHELDRNLVYCQGEVFDGFQLYEEFSEVSRAEIDRAGWKKLSFSTLLPALAENCTGRLMDEPERGKKGKNARAIRFIRVLAKRNDLLYELPLNAVLAAAANAIFDVEYSESDVSKLLNR